MGNAGIGLGTLFDRAARRHPANILVLDHDLDVAPELGRRLTITEVADLVADIASRLWAAGVRPGERIVVYKNDCFDIPLIAFAANRIGAVPVLLSPKLPGDVVSQLLARIENAYLCTDQVKLEQELPETVGRLTRQILLTSGRHPGAVDLRSLRHAPRVEPVATSPDHPALVTHTSGTTGLPKLAVHTSRTFEARYRPQAAVASLVRKRRPVAMHVSFVHSRLVTAVAIAALRGFPIVVLREDEPEHVAEIFARIRPGVLEAHPNTFVKWERLAADPRRPLASVKYFSSTFDAIHPRTVHRLLHASGHRFPVFGQLYGQSEVGPVVARAFTRRRRLSAKGGRCVGRTFPGMTSARVVSRDGQAVSADNPGYIEVRTDGRVLTYLGEDERYAGQLDGGWWRMGDLGYRTRSGRIYLLDREVDVIPGFGSTLAAEDVLFAGLDDLEEVVIVPGRDGRAVPVVCTVDDRRLDPEAWRAVTANLPPMAEPVHLRLEQLPQTATTKIKRLELARSLGQEHS
nr:AMP-binding protein [Kineosporia sp. NBRC 101731]